MQDLACFYTKLKLNEAIIGLNDRKLIEKVYHRYEMITKLVRYSFLLSYNAVNILVITIIIWKFNCKGKLLHRVNPIFFRIVETEITKERI